MQILKDVVVKSSTHTEEASCFTPRLSCFADTSTVGTDLNLLCDPGKTNTKLNLKILAGIFLNKGLVKLCVRVLHTMSSLFGAKIG